MLWLISTLKLLTEIALLALLGRGALSLWLGAQPERNPVYLLLDSASQPALWLARKLSPRWLLPAHLPWVAGAWVGLCWLVLTVLKIGLCLRLGLALCR